MSDMRKSEVMSISIPPDLRKQVRERAQKEGRSVSNMIAELLRRGMEQEKAT